MRKATGRVAPAIRPSFLQVSAACRPGLSAMAAYPASCGKIPPVVYLALLKVLICACTLCAQAER